jgi:energy-coupling factor transporter ATP-binding protein EcfA2
MLKRAESINDVLNVFRMEELAVNELEEFYYDGTMESRTGDPYDLPMQDILDGCQNVRERNAFLLLGHRGCGKSTEINKLVKALKGEDGNGSPVKVIKCRNDLDLENSVYEDYLILLGKALLEIAQELKCALSADTKNKIINFWNTVEEDETTVYDKEEISIDAGVKAESPSFLASVLHFMASLKTDLKLGAEKRKVFRTRIDRRASEWMTVLKNIAEKITEAAHGKQPVIIFEDVDKIRNQETAWNIFLNHSEILTDISIPLIYTFPIAFSYDTRYKRICGHFTPVILPMIKITNKEGKEYQSGINTITDIVEKRAELTLFEDKVLETLIKQTGGVLRDLFDVVMNAAKRANRRRVSTISMEDAERALMELRSSLTRMIEYNDYAFLIDICKYIEKREEIDNKEMLNNMLQGGILLEYNGKRWHNVHPLITDFFVDQRLITREMLNQHLPNINSTESGYRQPPDETLSNENNNNVTDRFPAEA